MMRILLCVGVPLLLASSLMAEESANPLQPILTAPDEVVLQGDFSEDQEKLDKTVWQSRQHTRWSMEEGVLRGRPSTAEFQASQEHHRGLEARLSVPPTPQDFALSISFRYRGGEAGKIAPFIEFGHHVVRVHFSADGARLLVDGESLLMGQAKEFQSKDGEWIDAFVELRGDEFVIQFSDGPTLYAKHQRIAGEKNGFGICGTSAGVVEIRSLKIQSVKGAAQAQGWDEKRKQLSGFQALPIVKPTKKKG
jgi:hypothetical protein